MEVCPRERFLFFIIVVLCQVKAISGHSAAARTSQGTQRFGQDRVGGRAPGQDMLGGRALRPQVLAAVKPRVSISYVQDCDLAQVRSGVQRICVGRKIHFLSCFLFSFFKTRDELKKRICNDCLIRKFGEENEKLDVLINNAGSESNK